MFIFTRKKKKTNILKIALLIVGVLAAVGVVIGALMFWKKKSDAEKQLDEYIESEIKRELEETINENLDE